MIWVWLLALGCAEASDGEAVRAEGRETRTKPRPAADQDAGVRADADGLAPSAVATGECDPPPATTVVIIEREECPEPEPPEPMPLVPPEPPPTCPTCAECQDGSEPDPDFDYHGDACVGCEGSATASCYPSLASEDAPNGRCWISDELLPECERQLVNNTPINMAGFLHVVYEPLAEIEYWKCPLGTAVPAECVCATLLCVCP